MIKALFFDLDDTLLWDQKSVKVAFTATCNIAKDQLGIDPNQLEIAVRKNARQLYATYPTYPFTQMIGINPFEGLWGEFNDDGKDFNQLKAIVSDYRRNAWITGLKDIGIDDVELGEFLAETFPIERKKHPFVFDDSFEVLDQLKHNYTLLLLTNGAPSLQNTKLSITPKLKTYFDHIVISGNFGKGKPDPSIFVHGLETVSLKRDEVLMIGDNLMTDILGATRAGIPSVWINRFDKERNEVKPDFEIKKLQELFTILDQ
ncbi:HAD family hydrolase [Terrihalobacillus insolitus]|uniref:HAD family hydrolase n=1 Tax=Terrihalobacillus insolitus TaxID=2950438 RepID=UPI0023410CF7|nr:HAD family hydrolase [Terrihalobacillus insolitus]MDC3415050.1 HAD family hydrolase [Terrihalobacillus insolitus]